MAFAAVGAVAFSLERRSRSRSRLWDEGDVAAPSSEPRGLGRWLSLAGYRRRDAVIWFVGACLGCLSLASLCALVFTGHPFLEMAAFNMLAIPVVGSTLARLVHATPWLLALIITSLPILQVRAQRARLIEETERDLPLVLELLATLAEGGLSFDAAIDRIVQHQAEERPLVAEFEQYQAETRAGGGRIDCLHRLANRLDVTPVTRTITAIAQAEEIGSSIAEVLRPLADELRHRRRERALATAEALPEKLVFPLVVGFLPGLLVWTLGPTLHQLINTVDSIMRGGR